MITQVEHTAPGMLKGKFAYMSPELALRGEGATGAVSTARLRTGRRTPAARGRRRTVRG